MNAVKKKTVKPVAKGPVRAAKKPVKKVTAKTVTRPVVVPVTTRPVVVSVSHPVGRPIHLAKRAEPQWLVNFKEFAAKNPAATVVGILAVTLALILLLGR